MENNKEIINKIAFLKEAINDDKLVIFAGSGVSVDSGLPLWKDLLENIKLKLNFNAEYENDSLKIAQLLFNEKGEKEYYTIVKEIIHRKSSNKYNAIHEIIYDLNPQYVVTTNYDNLFEQVIENEGLAFSVVAKDEDLPYAKHKNLLIKYHGDFENHNIVLKETDYLEFSKNHTLKEIFVKSLFSNKVILFIGYSFSDINLKLLNREMQYLLKKHHQRSYILNLSEDLSNSEKSYYENLGINIINYNQAKKEITNLDTYVNKEQIKLSNESAKVYAILNYLKNFDLDKYKYDIGNVLKEDQLIDELYNALMRFYYFRVLPEKFIANFYPLNKNYHDENNNFRLLNNTLMCFNDDLLDIIERYQGEHDENFSEKQREKLKYCIGRLIWSGVGSLAKASISLNSFNGYKVDEKSKISLKEKIKSTAKCDCINCNIERYNYSRVLGQLDNYVISESSELYDDLAYAFGLLSLFKYYKSYYAFKQLFVKANKRKKYEISFLSKYNMYRIGRNSSIFLLQNIESTEVKLIEKEIRNIDLDKELNKIKYFVDEKMYEFLREIKNGVYIQNLCDDVDENYFKIFKTKSLIQKGGSSSNNDISNLYKAIIKLENFREYNFIYGNGFSQINKTLEKSISAFFTAYSIKFIDSTDSVRFFGVPSMNHYDNYLLKMIIDYAKPSDLMGFLRDNDLNNIAVNKTVDIFISDISNLLDSAIEKTHYGSFEETKFISQIISDDHFANSIKTKLENICIVIAYFEFTPSHLNGFIKKLNNFIRYVKFIQGFEYKYLSTIISKKYDEIESALLVDTLDLFHSNRQYTSTYFLLANVLKRKDKNFITNSFNIENLHFDRNIENVYSIYECLNDKNKILFKTKLHDFLRSDEARTIDLCLAIDNESFVTDEIISKYKSKVNSLLQLEKKGDKYERNQDIQILNFINLLYYGKLDTIKIEKSKIQHEYYRFLVDPEKYQKQKFDPKWLKISSEELFISKFKKIPYVINVLENYLMENEDAELSHIYFRLRKKC